MQDKGDVRQQIEKPMRARGGNYSVSGILPVSRFYAYFYRTELKSRVCVNIRIVTPLFRSYTDKKLVPPVNPVESSTLSLPCLSPIAV